MLGADIVQLILYTGPQCSLCQQAMSLLLTQLQPGQITQVNVRDDTMLYHQYGARIPVIKRSDSQAELAWPFTGPELTRFLQ